MSAARPRQNSNTEEFPLNRKNSGGTQKNFFGGSQNNFLGIKIFLRGSQKFFWGSKIFFGGSQKISEISDFLTKNRKKKSGGIKIFFGKIPDFSKKIEKKMGVSPVSKIIFIYKGIPFKKSFTKEIPLK